MELLWSFLLGGATTLAAIFSGFDPDKAIGPVVWHSAAGLAIGLFDFRPRFGAVVAGITAFPVVLFGYLVVFGEVGNLWPIAMIIHGVIAAIPFMVGYALGLLVRLSFRGTSMNVADEKE